MEGQREERVGLVLIAVFALCLLAAVARAGDSDSDSYETPGNSCWGKCFSECRQGNHPPLANAWSVEFCQGYCDEKCYPASTTTTSTSSTSTTSTTLCGCAPKPQPACGWCGDLTGDYRVLATDCLACLDRAVGGDVELSCDFNWYYEGRQGID